MTLEKAVKERIEKARYLKRTGSPGKYKYVYNKPKKLTATKEKTDKKSKRKIGIPRPEGSIITRDNQKLIMTNGHWRPYNEKESVVKISRLKSSVKFTPLSKFDIKNMVDLQRGKSLSISFIPAFFSNALKETCKSIFVWSIAKKQARDDIAAKRGVLESAHHKRISDYIKKAPKYKGIVYRSLKRKLNLNVGDSYKTKGICSFSSEKEGHFVSMARTLFIINENKSGVDISKLSSFPYENEILTLSSNYKIMKKEYVYLSEKKSFREATKNPIAGKKEDLIYYYLKEE